MDALDLRIARALGVGPPAAYTGYEGVRPAAVARRVDASEQTVRDRLKRLEEAGIVEGYHLILHVASWAPPHRGLAVAVLEIPEAGKADALAALQGVPWVTGTIDFLGSVAYAPFAWRTQEERAERIAALETASGGRVLTLLERFEAREPRPLTALEARIFTMLAWDPFKPLHEVAEATGVTAKTVRAKLDRLEAERLFVARAMFDRAQFPVAFAHVLLLVDPASPPRFADVAAAVGENALFAHPPFAPGDDFDVGVAARNPAELEATRRALAAVPGVRRALALMPRETWNNMPYLMGLERAVLEASGTPPRPRAVEPAEP